MTLVPSCTVFRSWSLRESQRFGLRFQLSRYGCSKRTSEWQTAHGIEPLSRMHHDPPLASCRLAQLRCASAQPLAQLANAISNKCSVAWVTAMTIFCVLLVAQGVAANRFSQLDLAVLM
jgi:hypothetical protein